MGVLKALGIGEDSLLELMLLVVDMEAMEQLEERSSLLPPLEVEVDRLSLLNTPTRSPVSGFTEITRVLLSFIECELPTKRYLKSSLHSLQRRVTHQVVPHVVLTSKQRLTGRL